MLGASRAFGLGFWGACGLGLKGFLLGGSWDLVTRVIIRVTTLITPLRVLITLLTKSHKGTLLTKSHDPPSRVKNEGLGGSGGGGALQFRTDRECGSFRK